MSTTTDLTTLKINYLTQAQYDAAVSGGTINENELYLTPAGSTGVTDVEVDGTSVVSGGVAEIDLTGKSDTGHTHTTSDVTDFPSATGSGTTGVSVSDHSTSTIYGVQSSTTTASKVTLGTAKSVPNVTAAGSGSFTSGAFSGGSGSFSATVTDHGLSFSHTHTAATHGADSHTHTAPTLGTAISIPNVTAATDVTVPIKDTSSTTVVTSKTHTVTDSGHTHSI